ncbi:MAG: hypothetical protein AAFU85_31610, partial [Planctomycetota bacterium]
MSSFDQEPLSPVFRIDVSAEAEAEPRKSKDQILIDLMRHMVAAQQQQNQLLVQLVQQNNAANQQRASELQQWKDANP